MSADIPLYLNSQLSNLTLVAADDLSCAIGQHYNCADKDIYIIRKETPYEHGYVYLVLWEEKTEKQVEAAFAGNR